MHPRIKKTCDLSQRQAYLYGFMQNHSNDLGKDLNDVTNCFASITSLSCYPLLNILLFLLGFNKSIGGIGQMNLLLTDT